MSKSKLVIALIGILACGWTTVCIAQQSSQDLLKKLSSGSAEEKAAAADELGMRVDLAGQSVAALIKGLDDSDSSVRWRCARALGKLGRKASASSAALRKRLNDDNIAVVIQSTKALGNLGDSSAETVDALMVLVANPEAAVAREAIASLRNMELDPKKIVEAFGKVLASDQHAVIIHAVEALVERGSDSLPVIVEALKNEQAAIWACIAMEEIGPDVSDAIPHVVELLDKTKESQIRIHALLALAAMEGKAKSVADRIEAFAKSSKDNTERTAAAYALGSIGESSVREFLDTAAATDDPMLQMIGSWALAKLFPGEAELTETAINRLTSALASDDVRMRTVAARGLSQLDVDPEKVAPALIKLATDPDPGVVANVVDAMASLGKPIAARAGKALANKDLRSVALDVLVRLGPDAKDAIPDMVAALEGEDGAFKADVQIALANMGADAASAVKNLTASLSSSDERVRRSAMFALGSIGEAAADAGGSLKKIYDDSDGFDKTAACWSLVKIFPDNSQVVDAACQHLPSGLTNPQQEIRLEIVRTLGSFGSKAKKTIEALRQIAEHDPSADVREAAAKAIERINNN